MIVMWSALSALFVLALWGMQALLGYRGIAFTAWQWIVYAAWLLWTLAGVAFVWTFIDEREARPVWATLLVFGAPSVVVAVVLIPLWGLV